MLQIKNISKSFGKTQVLQDINLNVSDGELFFLLGPSGCGKSTLLRIISGLEKNDSGSITFNGIEWSTVPPEERNIGMVFQQYSLWPHMTVAENIAYGLKLRKVAMEEQRVKVNEALKQVGLEGFGPRKPGSLSGGQQQRAALARALVLNAKLILLDEPLSNLDARLRLELRSEIRMLQQRLGLTMIYVTHDQEEAMALADRMALMNGGVLEQTGTPEEVYHSPKTAFAALFFGKSTLLPAKVISVNGSIAVIALGAAQFSVKLNSLYTPANNEKVSLVVKPNAFTFTDSTLNTIKGKILFNEFQGTHFNSGIETDLGNLTITTETAPPAPGQPVNLALKTELLSIVPLKQEG
ncbi:MAG: ABC transporter ATP-binding protein [Fibrobacteres bacterium]|nr:ABC transporter ATP-binding protein [Fibrobacterota bacterium]